MPDIKYTDEDRERVYALYATGMAGREISRQLDIPEPTVRRWVKEARGNAASNAASTQGDAGKIIDLDGRRTAKKIEFIDSAWALINKSLLLADRRITRALEHEAELDEMITTIEDGELNEKQKSALTKKIRELQIQGVRELSTLIGTMYDKAALAAGDPTQKVDAQGGVVFAFEKLPDGTTEDDITG